MGMMMGYGNNCTLTLFRHPYASLLIAVHCSFKSMTLYYHLWFVLALWPAFSSPFKTTMWLMLAWFNPFPDPLGGLELCLFSLLMGMFQHVAITVLNVAFSMFNWITLFLVLSNPSHKNINLRLKVVIKVLKIYPHL